MQSKLLGARARRELAMALVLAVALWLTRSHDFTRIDSLPDASWAAFFVAGLLATRWLVPAALMMNAAVIDFVALAAGGSDYCVTPAYVFLIPTYLSLWAGGRWAALSSIDERRLPRIGLALALSVTGAFLISNASFYVFSGYFENMSVLAFVQAVDDYFVPFLEGVVMYTAVALVSTHAWRAVRAGLARRAGTLQ